ncbi:hypothetical protein [Acetonema longum]|uniref:Uncharacterized protein n=1 Tax=Acetonema longum DSM 6540 TaxID=1009370 RepID=F7NID5_9FIRM|nr:hypothetical protein [Acetonema longum]EGO64165.1 hypothetical protein ALO_09189 [Acetonema longum DSM 6540]
MEEIMTVKIIADNKDLLKAVRSSLTALKALGSGIKTLSASVAGNRLGQLPASTEKAGEAAAGAGKGIQLLGQDLSGIAAMGDSVASALLAVGNVVNAVVGPILTLNAKVQESKTAFGNMLGSADTVEALADEMAAFTGQTGQGIEQLSTLAQKIPTAEILQQKLGSIAEQIVNITDVSADVDQTIQALVEGAHERFSNMLQQQSNNLNGVIDEVRNKAALIAQEISNPLVEFANHWSQGIQDASDKLQDLINGGISGDLAKQIIPDEWVERITDFTTGIQTLEGYVKEFDANAGNLLGTVFANWADEAKSLAPVLEGVINGISNLLQTADQLSTSIVDVATVIVKDFGEITTFVTNAMAGIGSTVAQFGEELWDAAISLLTPVKDLLGGLVNQIIGGLFGSGGLLGNLFGFASGGRVHGPGTGTSDSILARLSNGEWVMQAAAVQHYGPRMMDALNRMMIPRTAVPGFAAGGLAGADRLVVASFDPVNMVNLELVNLVDQGVFDRYLETSNGKRKVINLLSDKRDSVRKVLF